MHYLNESNIFLFLTQVALLLGLARGLGLILRRFGQPAITGEIVVGILLGPTILGRFLPALHGTIFPANATQQTMLDTVAWLGILFFLLLTGLETDFSTAWRQKGEGLVISMADLVIPMGIAFLPSLLLPEHYLVSPDSRFLFAAFIATIMTISALPVTARALQELNLYRTDVALLIMCALTINDLAGWLVFAVILGTVTGTGMQVPGLVLILAGTAVFCVLALTAGRWGVDRSIRLIQRRRLPEPGTSLTFICLLGMVFGAITLKIGIHALFGFFLAGILAGESRSLPERTRHVIAEMVRAVLVPLFFATIGLKIDFLANFNWFLVTFILVIGIAGRFVGAWVGVTLTKHARENRMLISIAHTPGGEMQIVVGLLALEYRAITSQVYVAIVFGAVASSVILGPWMRWALSRYKRPPVITFLSPSAQVPALAGRTREAAMDELCEAASRESPTAGPGVQIAAAVKARERIMGTAIGNQMAIPHARLPKLRRPVVVVGLAPHGIEWDAPDGRPVHIIFLLLTPEDQDDAQVHILQGLADAFAEEEARERVSRATDSPSLWDALEHVLAKAPAKARFSS